VAAHAPGYDTGVTLFPGPSLDELRDAVDACTACDLYKEATQAVFGEGPRHAALMLMGEVPGDKEDLAGHPFVGPAGKVLDEALAEVGIDRAQIYLTNAVKHFKFERRGKVRIHKKPNAAEIHACSQWWQAELGQVHPEVLGILGATAGHAVFGPSFRVTKQRGEWLQAPDGTAALATIHPSAVLRAPPERRDAEYAGLVRDLRLIAARVA
jgi:uracil-DNA glycosylase